MDKNTGFHPFGQFVEAAFPESDRDIVPLTFKDGSTTYHYRGEEYLTEEEAIAARDGPSWGKKAVEFAGKTLMSSPTINYVVNKAGPVVEKVLGNQTVQDALSLPGEESVTGLVGDSFVKYGYPRILGETGTALSYPGPENPTKFDDVNRIFDATSDGLKLIDKDGSILRNSDGTINNNVFAIKGVDSSGRAPQFKKWFEKIDLQDDVKLDIEEMLYGEDSTLSQSNRRVIKSGIADETKGWGAFEGNKEELVKDFLVGLEDLDIPKGSIHTHHISALRVTASLFNGLDAVGRQQLRKILTQELGLSLGNNRKNLMALHKSPHRNVVHTFLDEQLGKYGEKLLDAEIMKTLSIAEREPYLKEFARIIKHSEQLAINSSAKWLDELTITKSPTAAFDAQLDMLREDWKRYESSFMEINQRINNNEPISPALFETISDETMLPTIGRTRVKAKKQKGKALLNKLMKSIENMKVTDTQSSIFSLDPDLLIKLYRQKK